MEVSIHYRPGRVSSDWPRAGYHFVKHDPDRIKVRTRVHVGGLYLFGRHVINGTDRGSRSRQVLVCQRAGNSEIHQLCDSTSGQHDIGRLDIAMNYALTVRIGQRAQHLQDDIEARARIDCPLP